MTPPVSHDSMNSFSGTPATITSRWNRDGRQGSSVTSWVSGSGTLRQSQVGAHAQAPASATVQRNVRKSVINGCIRMFFSGHLVMMDQRMRRTPRFTLLGDGMSCERWAPWRHS